MTHECARVAGPRFASRSHTQQPCRCTGYVPIIEGRAAGKLEAPGSGAFQRAKNRARPYEETEA
jgi:xanthine dehydrogenase iron-sulfur cluster and FAD-binding subunit A